MKKILFALPLLFAMIFAACDATIDDKQPAASVTADELTNSFELVARSEGNNNITVALSPVHYVKVYSSDNTLLAEGTNPTFQVTPPTTDLSVYITVINQDGSITKSSEKSIHISEYTDLPAIYEQVFGLENGEYGTTVWTWDDTLTRYWGNGSWGSDTTPSWWGAPDGADINEQCSGKGMPNDGTDAWFSLSLTGVETSRGETGSVKVTEETAVAGWGMGTMTFTGTVPLLGVLPNDGNQRCYTYQVLQADGEHLVLAAQSIGNSSEGWFFCFKRIER
ncbi:hypothetical protein I6E10_00270 [Phocaeicola barnesiae]|uniref:hypothetical protein n=1 Tax=Phocaeicola barnesiae TaxID=376804 RepID=UPI001F1B0005|nr:hypothetical protein [Phocaeicola barnesiae]MCF2597207.1 hypothetical protein [Phocaeicola barnesiae]